MLLALQQRQAEVSARSTLVKNVGESEKQARAVLFLVQRRGVDIDMLRRTVGTRRDEEVTAGELVRLYGKSLRLEAEELDRLVHAAEIRLEQNRKQAREHVAYQVTEERLRTTKDQTAKFTDALIMQLQDRCRPQLSPEALIVLAFLLLGGPTMSAHVSVRMLIFAAGVAWLFADSPPDAEVLRSV